MESRSFDYVTPVTVNTNYRTMSNGDISWYGIRAPRETSGLYDLSSGVTVGYINSATDTDIYRVPAGCGTPIAGSAFRVIYAAVEYYDKVDFAINSVSVHSYYATTQIISNATVISGSTELRQSFNDPYGSDRSRLTDINDGIAINSYAFNQTSEGWVYFSAADLPGDTSTVRKYAIAETPTAAYDALRSLEPAALQLSPGSSASAPGGGASSGDIFRFYNKDTGTHFYTGNATERDNVLKTLPNFVFEGNVFDTYATATTGSAVYRFLNKDTGSHFYTISVQERDRVANTPSNLVYEGEAYKAYTADAAGRTELYRFLETNSGTHFYTTSESEKQNVINTLPSYRYEGVAFYVDIA